MIFIVLPDISTEDKLLLQAKGGDQQALMQIYNAYFEPVYAFVRLRVDDPMTAEDLTSDVFIKLLKSLQSGKAPKDSLRGWLFQVARNTIYDHYGEKKKAVYVELEDWLHLPGEEQPDTHLIQQAERQRLQQAVHQLPDEQQEVLLLRFGQSLSLKDTSDIMGKSTGAIKSLQFRAIESLRRLMIQKADLT